MARLLDIAIKTAAIQDDSDSITSYYITGAHTTASTLTRHYSGHQINGIGFNVAKRDDYSDRRIFGRSRATQRRAEHGQLLQRRAAGIASRTGRCILASASD